jgi:hypothetical protein
MGSTVEIRAQIDTETVRGLQLMNCGSAAALSAMLPVVLQNPGLRPLANWMIVAIGLGAVGLAAAIFHNRLRRKCSLYYDRDRGTWGAPYIGIMARFATEPGEPRVCTRSVIWMYASFVLFIGVIGTVVAGARLTIGRDIPATFTCWELKEVSGRAYKFNTCTGAVQYQELPDSKVEPPVQKR